MRFPTMIVALTVLGAVGCKDEVAPAATMAKTAKIGDSLQAFIVQNCETKSKYCQVCKFGGQPTIMAVGSPGDAGFEQDLVAIEKLIQSQKDKGLTAFALVAKLGASGVEHFDDEAKVLADLAATQKRLKLSFPVVIAPSEVSEAQKANYPSVNDAYALSPGRTLFFAGADNLIVFAEKLTDASRADSFKRLDTAVSAAL